MRNILLAALFVSVSAPLRAADTAFQALLENSSGDTISSPSPEIVPSRADGSTDLEQYLPPDNDEPGFEWPGDNKGLEDNFIYIGKEATYFKATTGQAETLTESLAKCALAPKTVYKTSVMPGFQ